VLVLGIETSSRHGSVALVENGRLLAEASNDAPNTHGERLLQLVDELFLRAGKSKSELNRVAVGRGPGAFTGLRIGLAVAQGIAVGLGAEAVGMGSLEAMALGLPPSLPGLRFAVLDARRQELFLAGYRDNGTCVLPPLTLPRDGLLSAFSSGILRDLLENEGLTSREPRIKGYLLGAVLDELSPTELDREALTALGLIVHRSSETDFPGASTVARAASVAGAFAPATPDYLRDADAIKPDLPPCPLPSSVE
jgi:tRNA threonylcarbamoyl adenosine modification protein YeaZ